MVTKDDLKDWLAENERQEYARELEDFIDNEIKKNALEGNTTFYIRTGDFGRNGSVETPFNRLWYTDRLSKENRKIVQEEVLRKYFEFGFEIKKTTVDCGWHNNYFALFFEDIDKLIE